MDTLSQLEVKPDLLFHPVTCYAYFIGLKEKNKNKNNPLTWAGGAMQRMDIKPQEELSIKGSLEEVDQCNIFCSPLKPAFVVCLFVEKSQLGGLALLNRPFSRALAQPLPLVVAALASWAAAWTKKGTGTRHSGPNKLCQFSSFPFELVKELFLNLHGSPELVVSAFFFYSALILAVKMCHILG